VAEVALRRDQLDVEIKAAIESTAAGWGIDIISVKVRDIVLPDELQEAMSLEAQAEREKNARMTLAEIEGDIADILANAALLYHDPDAAMKLRTMLVLYETVKKSKGTVVTIPSSISDSVGEGAVERLVDSLKSQR
jgi:regulator of protease activity HflC (stomatin/prohibitin superfamily)